jgi:subtilisin family serine protease
LVNTTKIGGGYREFSGTSASAPHISGLAALYIGLHGRAENAADVYTIRQNIINGGIEQTDSRGFQTFTDPDTNPEPIGYYIRGDFDYTGQVNHEDLAMLAESWLTADTQKDIFPLGGDGNVDFADLSVFSELWLK